MLDKKTLLDKKTFLQLHASSSSAKQSETKVIALIAGQVVSRISKSAQPDTFVLEDKEAHQFFSFLRERITLGQWRGQNCEVWDLAPEAEEVQGYELVDLRALLVSLPDAAFSLVSRAVQLIEWRKTCQFCSRCAAKLIQRSNEHAMHCNHCAADYYPRISPCIIVMVTHQDKCLLARQAKWPSGRYSAIAGFIEAGESAEQAVLREVYEEVGIEVEDISYFGSQAWPFPGQLMLGYKAKARTTDIIVDGVEISDAKWWHYQQLPDYVPPSTIMAGRLIQSFIDEMAREVSQH